MNNDQDCKIIYGAVSDTDRTEGRGESIYYLCETYSTAERIGKGKGVQGFDCKVIEIELTKFDNQWVIPINYVYVYPANQEDKEKEAEKERLLKEEETRRNLVSKLQDLELTMDEVDLLVKMKILNRMVTE